MDEYAHPQGVFPGETEPGYEVRDANSRAIVKFGIGLIVGLVVVMVLLLVIVGSMARRREELPPESAPPTVTQELKKLRVEEEKTLISYDKIAGEPEFARIPIDRAMDLMVKKGVPFGKGRKTEIEVNTRIKQP